MVRAIGLLGGGALLLGAGALGGSIPVNAQQQQLFHLEVTADQAQLMVQTLGAVQCTSVAQMGVCQKAKELLEAIQAQARQQSGNQ